MLVPCLLLLSLGSVLAVGLLATQRLEVKGTAAWDQAYRARLAGASGKALAYLHLASDPGYGGETGTLLPEGAGSFDVTVTQTDLLDRAVDVTGRSGNAVFHLLSTAHLTPKAFRYTVTALGDFDLKGASRVMGDVYAAGVFQGESTAVITGDVSLYGSRTILTDVNGKVISVDGKAVPAIEGAVTDEAEALSLASCDLANLKLIAIGEGRYYGGKSVTFTNQDLTGVVYLGPGTDASFENVTIRGILVAEPQQSPPKMIPGLKQVDSKLIVKNGFYLKVIADPGVVEDAAILAPQSALVVENNAFVDVAGVAITGMTKVRALGEGVFTGPLYVNGKFVVLGDVRFQAPASTRDGAAAAALFPDFEVLETGYVEP